METPFDPSNPCNHCQPSKTSLHAFPRLFTSMDGISFHIPPELIPSHAKPGKDDITGYFQNTWFHTDQSYLRSEFECIQGQVPLYDVNAGDATLCILEGSHQHHAVPRTIWYDRNR